jgi:uncharacterized protein
MSLTFEPVRLDRQYQYREKLAQCGQIASDYSFINIWGWGEEYGLEWAWQEELVWIRQTKPEPALWAPVGDWRKVDWANALKTAGTVADRIVRVPETLANALAAFIDPAHPPVELRHHWDYLYSLQELVELKGNRFHKKKNLLNQFLNTYTYTYLGMDDAMIEQALSMQEDWCTWRDCESNDTLAAENKSIARVLNRWHDLHGITGGALVVDEILVAYTIAETMPDMSLVIHFEKGCPDYKGCYQAINQMFLAHAPSGYTRVNREQDLGDEGLRKAKLSYHPMDFVKKYEVRLHP